MAMTLPDDFKDFLKSLELHGVEYLLIGGYAVVYHGYPRATGDLDVWVAVSRENADRIVMALRDFGFGDADLSPDPFLRSGQIIRMGNIPLRIEILTSISGVEFDEFYRHRIVDVVDGVKVDACETGSTRRSALTNHATLRTKIRRVAVFCLYNYADRGIGLDCSPNPNPEASMAGYEFNAHEVERRFDELLQAMEGGCEILISQGGKPLAQLVMPSVEHVMDFVRGDGEPFYAVVIEKGEHGYAAYVPDLPECIAMADTEDEVENLIGQAMALHLEALREDGAPPPDPATRAVYVQPAGREHARRGPA
jgi:predicted RNase H-like HicB family nuclease